MSVALWQGRLGISVLDARAGEISHHGGDVFKIGLLKFGSTCEWPTHSPFRSSLGETVMLDSDLHFLVQPLILEHTRNSVEKKILTLL